MHRLTAVALALVCLTFAHAADARPKHARIAAAASVQCIMDNDGRTTCGDGVSRIQHRARAYSDATIIGGRPAGCPHRYCGCGLARYLGIDDKRLNLAWNWARLYPRARPAPGMAVVWRHHVALIVSMVGPGEALLRDYNSGRGLSRIHVRSIAGAVVVNPRAMVASR